jgi:hypothetical protein
MPGHLPVATGKDIPFIPERFSHASVLTDILLDKENKELYFFWTGSTI